MIESLNQILILYSRYTSRSFPQIPKGTGLIIAELLLSRQNEVCALMYYESQAREKFTSSKSICLSAMEDSR